MDGTDEHGNTLLHIACQNGHKRLAKILLRGGADVNLQNMRGQSPLHFCFAFNYQVALEQCGLVSPSVGPWPLPHRKGWRGSDAAESLRADVL